jgi:hypothetical protein
MTEYEMNRILEAMEKHGAELSKSKEATWKFLIEAGIETEESRRKHEAKEKKKESKK